MPTTTRTRTIDAPASKLWELVRDPHHLPRWWPRVTRVEGVDGQAFTEVLRSDRGRTVRADFLLLSSDEQEMRLVFSQQIEGTPFATVLRSAETELQLRELADGEATEVTITLSQTLRAMRDRERGSRPVAVWEGASGLFTRIGNPMVRRAAAKTLDEALDGLAQIAG